MADISSNNGFSNNEAFNHSLGLCPKLRISTTTTQSNVNAFAVVAINGPVVLGAGINADGFQSGDTLPEGIIWYGLFKDIQLASGTLICYKVSTSDQEALQE